MQTNNYFNFEDYHKAADYFNRLARSHPARVRFVTLSVGQHWRYRVYWW